MNFETLIAELVEKIDEKESPDRKTRRHSLARSLALSKTEERPTARVDARFVGEHDGLDAQNSLKQNVSLDLDYKDLSVSLRTEQSIALEACMLKAQVATLAEQLAHANSKLDQSHRKIGFLEAQLLIQDEQIRQLKPEPRERPKKKRSSKGRQVR